MLFYLNGQLLAGDWRIAIVQSIKHPALDDVASGVQEYFLQNRLPAEFTLFILDQDSDQEKVISRFISGIESSDPHLIISIGTQASQLVADHIEMTPAVFSAVTDPKGAGLVDDHAVPGKMMTGLTDISPVSAQLDMIIRLQPEIRSLGMVFSEFEQNAVIIRDRLGNVIENHGISLVQAPVGRGEKAADKALEILDRIEALYISTDNYVVSQVSELAVLCASAGVPLYAADPSSVAGGAVAALSIDYFRMGLQTGAMSQRVLEGADPSSMPVERPREMNIFINIEAAGIMGLDLPMEIILAADTIFDFFPAATP